MLNDTHQKEAEEEKFLNIVLNIQNEKERDFFKAWENAFNDKVKGYESDHGKVEAEKSTWIHHLPKVLCFQLNRIEFDRNSMQQIKKQHEFPIQLVIHPDRFLYKNKAEVEQLRQKVVVI